MKSSIKALPGPESNAETSSISSTQLTFATPPTLRIMKGLGSSPMIAWWKRGTRGAPWPPLSTSFERKSFTTSISQSFANKSPSPIWIVIWLSGSWWIVWPWKPIRSIWLLIKFSFSINFETASVWNWVSLNSVWEDIFLLEIFSINSNLKDSS